MIKAPYLKVRPRKGDLWARFWIPPARDVAAGWPLKSIRIEPDIEAPDATTAKRIAADKHAGNVCRKHTRALIAWRKGQDRPQHGTFAWLIERYESDGYGPLKEIGAATEREYLYYNRIIKAALGERRIASTTGLDLKRWFEAFSEGHHMRKAKGVLGQIRRLAAYAVFDGQKDCSYIKELFESTRFKAPAPKRGLPPTWDHIVAFVKAADELGLWSVGTATLMQFETGQRQGDIIGIVTEGRWRHGVTWNDINFSRSTHGTVAIIQNKTGKRQQIAMSSQLSARLKSVPAENRIGPVIILETTGRPFRADTFRKKFRKVAKAAKWPDEMWSMDCRAGAVTEAIDHAGVIHELTRKLTGHTTSQAHLRYDRDSLEATEKVVSLREASRA